ncbi:MAG TPA: sigma-70 family RNA polymerase sigma factor [Allosphingosinicella sp.]|jgi:RNA polymerase sigma-70 factor (ECF subfamily)|nr:sigma-70 family RNA polymerase sigma factor [Allosphingosinicella sp.]
MSAPRFDPNDPEQLARLGRAIARLPAREREIFVAVRVEGLSYAEVAERTGMTPEKVTRQVARALRRLDFMLHPPRRPWWRRWL